MKGPWLNILKVTVTVVALAVVLTTVDLRGVWSALRGADVWAIVVAIGLYQVGIAVRAYRWRALLVAQCVRVPFARLVGLYYVGTFYNNFLPSGFGGDVIRAVELTQHGASASTSVSTVVVDRVMGLLVLFGMALIALPLTWPLVPPNVTLALVVLIGSTGLLVLLFLVRERLARLVGQAPRIARLLANDKLAELSASFGRPGTRALLVAAAASLVFNISLVMVQMLLGHAVGVDLGVGYFLVFVPILSSLLMLPISISGLGVRESGYVLLFGQVGVSGDRAVAMSLLFYGVNLATGLAGGLIYLIQNILGVGQRHAVHLNESQH